MNLYQLSNSVKLESPFFFFASLFEIDELILEKIFQCWQSTFAILLLSSQEKGHDPSFFETEFLLHKNTLCEVCLNWPCASEEEDFKNFVNIFLFFCFCLPL